MGLDDLEGKHILCFFVIIISIGATITIGFGMKTVDGIVTEKGYSKTFDGESVDKDYWVIINGQKYEVSYVFVYRNIEVNDTIQLNTIWEYGYGYSN